MKIREENISISERDLMYAVGGQLFAQAPNRSPRKAELIMEKLRDSFRDIAYNDNEYYSLVVSVSGVNNLVEKLLMSIPEFEELNLTHIEYQRGIEVNDPNRPKFCFTSMYNKETPESWKNDFIDLDAFIRNVTRNLYTLSEIDKECEFCSHQGSELCKSCNINEDFRSYYEGRRNPKGRFTFACKHNCFRHYYICCEECDKSNTCTEKCEGSSNLCGNAINRIKK